MTPDQTSLRVRVAAEEGWTFFPTPVGGATTANWQDKRGEWSQHPPNYDTSWNAIIPAILRRFNDTAGRVAFLGSLRTILGDTAPRNRAGSPVLTDFDLFAATPEQLCRAYLAAGGKGEA